MNSEFKITIPKPCHKDWNKMTEGEKGRFCSSCAKTVIDFTKQSTEEIEAYLVENKNKRTCGHFYKKQLDSITIEIPQVTFNQQLSFQKLFILSLFFAMGTSLFSCKYSDGKKQKIQNVIVVDTIKSVEEKIDSLIIEKDSMLIHKGNLPKISCVFGSKNDSIIDITTVGEVVETFISGDLAIEGEIAFEENVDEELMMGLLIIEEPPRFKESKKLSREDARIDFEDRMKLFVQKNFNVAISNSLGLNIGKYKIHTQFVIDTLGYVRDVKVRAPHFKLKKEIIRMLEKLPQFIPGKQNNKKIKTSYMLPISFEIE